MFLNIAEAALADDDSLKKVIIIKRLPRYDIHDPLGLKSELSKFGNTVYDFQWLKKGSNSKIQILDINLDCSQSKYLKSIIFGNPGEPNYDGLHFRGKSAARHFTYRATQALKPVFMVCGVNCPQEMYQEHKRQNWTNQRTAYKSQSQSSNTKGQSVSFARKDEGGNRA